MGSVDLIPHHRITMTVVVARPLAKIGVIKVVIIIMLMMFCASREAPH